MLVSVGDVHWRLRVDDEGVGGPMPCTPSEVGPRCARHGPFQADMSGIATAR
jgi:hypothetical protein